MSAELEASDPPEIVPTFCPHKHEIGCVLTNLLSCCSCTDQRPVADAYPVYIDGEGMKMRGQRWQLYCWKCRDYWNLAEDNNMSPSPEIQDSNEQTIQQTYPEVSGVPSGRSHNRHQSTLNPLAQTWAFPPRENLGSPSHLIPLRHMTAVEQDASEGVPNNPFGQPLRQGVLMQEHGHSNPNNSRHTSRQHGSAQYAPPRDAASRSQQHTVAPPNPFGSREEIEAEDYQSPLAGMFGRAWTRYRDAEEARQSVEARHSPEPSITAEDPFGPPNRLYSRHLNHMMNQIELLSASADLPAFVVPELRSLLARDRGAGGRDPMAMEDLTHAIDGLLAHHALPPVTPDNAIDDQKRPKALPDKDMTIDVSCKVCGEQRSDTLYEPCMHIGLCRWCSEIYRKDCFDPKNGSIAERKARWTCPICRERIKTTRRVYLV